MNTSTPNSGLSQAESEVEQLELVDLPHPWLIEDIAVHDAQKTFVDVGNASIQVLSRLSSPIAMLSGPMWTGGCGNPVLNLAAYSRILKRLERRGWTMFNQLPAEKRLDELKKEWVAAGNKGYCLPLLEGYYGTLFGSGLVDRIFFMHGFEKSTGASWEHDKAVSLGLKISHIQLGW